MVDSIVIFSFVMLAVAFVCFFIMPYIVYTLPNEKIETEAKTICHSKGDYFIGVDKPIFSNSECYTITCEKNTYRVCNGVVIE